MSANRIRASLVDIARTSLAAINVAANQGHQAAIASTTSTNVSATHVAMEQLVSTASIATLVTASQDSRDSTAKPTSTSAPAIPAQMGASAQIWLTALNATVREVTLMHVA